MRHRFAVLTGLASVPAVLCLGANLAHARECQSLAGKTFGNAQVVETEDVASPITITLPSTGSSWGLA